MSDEERISRLEEALAHHEAMVSDLSDELAKQWLIIERLERTIQDLEVKLENMRPAADAPGAGEPPPPHY